MDDSSFGTRDRRGEWTPNEPITYPPVFVWPVQPLKALKWAFGFPGFFLPWNLTYAVVAILVWFFATPPIETMKNFEPGWMLFILVRNAALTLVWFGAWHLRLYIRRSQGGAFKYNPKWPATDSPTFMFRNQTIDNMIWTFASAVPVWTAYECVTMWMFANRYIPFVEFAQHPVWFIVLMLLVPPIREIHFYLVHRLIHWPPLYRTVHRIHHKNVNPGPWSGMAMHPVEHVLYFSNVLVHWVIPSHPLHAIYTLVHLAMAPAPGHVGFDRLVVTDKDAMQTGCYDHYLHHKHFEVNYADGMFPLDKWFGTFHDGTPEAEARMKARLEARALARRSKKNAAAG